MAAIRSAASSYATAAILAALTLFVFYTFRDYGPASTVRRFHDDVQTDNGADLQRVTYGQLNSVRVNELIETLLYWDARNPNPNIAATQMIQPDEASVITVYRLMDRNVFLVWIVRKEPNQPWKVDPELTMQARMSLGNHE